MYKNRLQEFFQKNKKNPPFYNTEMSLEENNTLTWFSTLKINDTTIKGDKKQSKVMAEQDVAEKALIFLKTEKEPGKNWEEIGDKNEDFYTVIGKFTKEIETKNIVLFVDLENFPQISKYINIPINTGILGFVSHLHPLSNQKLPFLKCVAFSSVKDASDHLLTFSTGILYKSLHKKKVFILTKDHCGECTTMCLKNLKINAVHITTISEKDLTRL
jgi:hypothetical protein